MSFSPPLAHIGVSLGANGGTSSPGIDTTGADLIVLIIGYYSGTSSISNGDISDNKGNGAPTGIGSATSDDGEGATGIFYWRPSTVGSGHTWTISKLSTFVSICVIAVSDSNPSGGDQHANHGSTGAVTTIQPGSITPTESNELIVCAFGGDFSGSPMSIDGGFTIVDQVATVGGQSYASSLAYLIQTSAAAANPTWSGFNSRASSTIASFKDTPTGGAVQLKGLTSLGVGF